MIEIWKVLIERVLGWPVAVLLLGIVFRHHVANFWARIDHLTLTHGKTSVEAKTGLASGQNAKPEASETITGSLTVTKPVMPAELQTARETALDFGKGLEPVQVRETGIENYLASLNFTKDDSHTIPVLVRNLAFMQWIAHSERTYRLIFGSQIALLKYLHENGAKPEIDAQKFFNNAVLTAPSFYGNYTYHAWLEFMLNQQLLLINSETGTLEITRAGRGFLIWMTMEAVSENQRG